MCKESEIKNLAADEAVAYSASQLKYQETLAAVDYAARQSYEQRLEQAAKSILLGAH